MKEIQEKDAHFCPVGIRPDLVCEASEPMKRRRRSRRFPWLSALVLSVIVLGCVFCRWIMTKDPMYMDLLHYNLPPGGEYLFGTDTMGRDIFSMIWYGGRASLCIGFAATAVTTVLAVLIGSVSGLSPGWLDGLLMRLTDIALSIPGLLLVIFLQAVFGDATVWSLSLVIGLTGWMSMAKVVRSEVRQIRASEYVTASRCMGAGFLHILRRHLLPNFFPSIMFMVVMNIRTAIVSESTLSFLGMGLPLEVISWGSMLSLAEQALSGGSWWMIVIPGGFLVITLLCVTSLGNYLRRGESRRHSNL